jgi:hypothetical protein
MVRCKALDSREHIQRAWARNCWDLSGSHHLSGQSDSMVIRQFVLELVLGHPPVALIHVFHIPGRRNGAKLLPY